MYATVVLTACIDNNDNFAWIWYGPELLCESCTILCNLKISFFLEDLQNRSEQQTPQMP